VSPYRVVAPMWAVQLIPCPECSALSGKPCRSGGRDGGLAHPTRRRLADEREAAVASLAAALGRHARVGRSCACGWTYSEGQSHEHHQAREIAAFLARTSARVVHSLSMEVER